ncbi:hypothetical protein WR25_16051 [Diploscapter pachys]|uniref:Coiled-coil domain-containing protein n=1 Tax=Diploscapter pachys TaxID=2018661 RepID=A0A2A2KJ32_9BILA|nr:hypothetical protein WR25_16051 [Diploscapter pachys]
MPKKFTNENSKVIASRERKAAVKQAEHDKKQKAAEDAYWADDDKLANRKLQRKDDEEKKKLEAQKKREELKKLAEEEMNALSSKAASSSQPQKVTRAALDQHKEAEAKLAAEEEMRKKLAAQKIAAPEDLLEENRNLQNADVKVAKNVDEALVVLDETSGSVDKHPEKRMKAAYLAFEESRLPQLKVEHPTYRLSQLKQLLKKEWQNHPTNPLVMKIQAAMGN